MSKDYLYHTFHSRSSGQNSRYGFTAGQSARLNRRNYQNVRGSLQSHFNRGNYYPTPWISTTNDLLRALTIAVNWYSQGKTGVSIAVIDPENCEPESAEDLSYEYRLGDPVLRKTEFLCENQINMSAVVECVSFERLVIRGLYDLVPEFDLRHWYWFDQDGDSDIPLADMRNAVKNTLARTGGRGYWTNMGARAAELACLFRVGVHTGPMAGEVVAWWLEEEDCSPWKLRYIEKGADDILRSLE